jgi:hypothetical protein
LFIWARPPRFFSGRPTRACALPAPADKPAPPISSTAARHCAAAHPSALSLHRSVRSARVSAAHVARERRPRAATGRRPPVGARPHGTPASRGTPTPGPQLFPPLFLPLPRCRRVARSPLTLLHSFSRLHSSPTPPLERPSLPTAPHTRTAASSHR